LSNPYTLSRADRARYDMVLRTIGDGGARGIVRELIAALDQSDAWSMRVLANLARAGMRRELQLHAARGPAEISNASTMRITDLLQRIRGSSSDAAPAIERLVHYATEGAGYDWRRRYHVWDPLSQRPTPN
jgi:hypothetical protein